MTSNDLEGTFFVIMRSWASFRYTISLPYIILEIWPHSTLNDLMWPSEFEVQTEFFVQKFFVEQIIEFVIFLFVGTKLVYQRVF